MRHKALLVIDPQNDYFPDGKFPLWNTTKILENMKKAIKLATINNIQIIHIQHVADPSKGIAPFFNEHSDGVKIHPAIVKITATPEIIIKRFADAFEQTDLANVLKENNIEELLLCGMMTQNCVTHTAISKAADNYKISVLSDCCTSVSEMIHKIALNALSTRVSLISTEQMLD